MVTGHLLARPVRLMAGYMLDDEYGLTMISRHPKCLWLYVRPVFVDQRNFPTNQPAFATFYHYTYFCISYLSYCVINAQETVCDVIIIAQIL